MENKNLKPCCKQICKLVVVIEKQKVILIAIGLFPGGSNFTRKSIIYQVHWTILKTQLHFLFEEMSVRISRFTWNLEMFFREEICSIWKNWNFETPLYAIQWSGFCCNPEAQIHMEWQINDNNELVTFLPTGQNFLHFFKRWWGNDVSYLLKIGWF